MIARLHAASLAPHHALPMVAGADLTPFLTQQRYSIGILLSNLRWIRRPSASRCGWRWRSRSACCRRNGCPIRRTATGSR
jgi:hypothetical protein